MVEQWTNSTTLVVDLDQPYEGELAALATKQLAAPSLSDDRRQLIFTVVPGVRLNDLPANSLADAGGSYSRDTIASEVVLRLMSLGCINEE